MSGELTETRSSFGIRDGDKRSNLKEFRIPEFLKTVLQISHLVIVAAIFLIGVVEFSVELSVFDIFGKSEEGRSIIPADTFNHTSTFGDKSLGHILDAPILFLFLIYFLSVLWLKCRGVYAWLLTVSQVVCILLYLGVNAGLSQTVLDWRHFSTRAVIILLDVLILSFSWTVIIVTLLHIRGWFPFKVKKIMEVPYHKQSRLKQAVVVFWNFIALYLVLGLCLLIWFSKLYMSWACVRSTNIILLMCQFTNMVQCWPCTSSTSTCDVANISRCVNDIPHDDLTNPIIRCISPLYTVEPFPSAFCVFNYNIGPFTFLAVFSYVGGIYFFMRTVLNALVKCVFSILYIALHYCISCVPKLHKSTGEFEKNASINENDTVDAGQQDLEKPQICTDPRVSLLGPLPPYYYSTPKNTNKNKQS